MDLIERLYAQNYKAIHFPGSTPDLETYFNWRQGKEQKQVNQDTCDGFGVVLRLQDTKDGSILRPMTRYLDSEEFWNALMDKFGIDAQSVYRDIGIQKYLDGYEISPHPDIRKKALTFMVNINPGKNTESLEYHTHYIAFSPEHAAIRTFWENNPDVDRCWIPWDWCETKKQQTRNNSIVIFSPGDDTIHAVKATYDHFQTQRTQIYGNLWYNQNTTSRKASWQDLAALPS